MDKLIPWQVLCSVIKAGIRSPRGLGRMLRMYFITQRLNFTDETRVELLYDTASARQPCNSILAMNRPTHEKFWHLLERQHLGEQLFTAIRELLLNAAFSSGKPLTA